MTLRERLLVPAMCIALTAGCRPADGPSWPAIKAEVRERFADVPQLTVDEFAQRRTDRTLVVDVRAPEEYHVSHLEGAVNLTDADAITRLARETSPDAVVLYCSVGYRSSDMVERLLDLGVADVYNLEGSIFEWANEGRPVYGDDGRRVDQVHPYDERWGRLLRPELRWSGQ